jgi:AcrR family transcriptional regulator
MAEERRIPDVSSVPIAPGDRSAHVRAAVREAAVRLFTERGYVATGVRDIARAAGADPAIVIRHFGSKEALFIETMTLPETWRDALRGPVDELGRALVDLIARRRDGGFGPWAALVRASDRPDVGRVYRSSVTAVFAEGVASRLEGPDAQVRAHLFAAQVEGLLSSLSIREDRVLLDLPHDELVDRYGAILQATLTGP